MNRTSITFKKGTSKRIKLLKKQFQRMHDSFYSSGGFQLLESGQYDTVLEHLQKWTCKTLFVIQYPKPNFLKQIAHVDFKKLSNIQITQCEIINIEALTFLDLPNLNMLRLSQNFIHFFKPFAKCHFPNLRRIALEDNMSNHGQLNFLTRIKADSEQTENIKLEGQKFFPSQAEIEEIEKMSKRIEMVTQLIKYESKHLDRINFSFGYYNRNEHLDWVRWKTIMSDQIRDVFQRRSFDEERERIHRRFSVQGATVIDC